MSDETTITADCGDEDRDEWYEAYRADRAARRAAPPVAEIPVPVTSWTLFATPDLRSIGPSLAQMRIAHGGEIVPVTCTEDPDGSHYGFAQPDDTLVMVRRGLNRFETQFPYGSGEAVRDGRGRVVRLRVEDQAC